MDAVVLNTLTAIVEGSVGTIQSRVRMAYDDLAMAHFVLHEYTDQ